MELGFRKIQGYVGRHWREHSDIRFLIPWVVFMTLSIYLRYSSGVHLNFNWLEFPTIAQILFYSIPFVFTLILYAVVYKKVKEIFTLQSLIAIFVICFVLYANQYMLLYQGWIANGPSEVTKFLNSISYNLHVSFFFVAIPVVYFWFAKYSGVSFDHFYGLRAKGFNFTPYAVLLLGAFPFVVWASFQPGFQQLYPRYLPNTAESYWSVSPYLTVVSYQISYVLQFITLELFYRGFIIFALARFIKGGAVWPMVTVYCFLHFTKPLPEAIAAIFGGYLLGVIAYYSRSIFGGIFVHVGIALLMELLAYGAIFVW